MCKDSSTQHLLRMRFQYIALTYPVICRLIFEWRRDKYLMLADRSHSTCAAVFAQLWRTSSSHATYENGKRLFIQFAFVDKANACLVTNRMRCGNGIPRAIQFFYINVKPKTLTSIPTTFRPTFERL